LQDFCDEQAKESRSQRLRISELEQQLAKMKKYVLLDDANYTKMLSQSSLSPSMSKIIQTLLHHGESNLQKKIIAVLDLVLKQNVSLESDLAFVNDPRLKHDYHRPAILGQAVTGGDSATEREMKIRMRASERGVIVKLES